jgi:hypothetical protein
MPTTCWNSVPPRETNILSMRNSSILITCSSNPKNIFLCVFCTLNSSWNIPVWCIQHTCFSAYCFLDMRVLPFWILSEKHVEL